MALGGLIDVSELAAKVGLARNESLVIHMRCCGKFQIPIIEPTEVAMIKRAQASNLGAGSV